MACEDTRRYAGLQRSGKKMVLPSFCSLKVNLRRNQDSEKKVPITKADQHQLWRTSDRGSQVFCGFKGLRWERGEHSKQTGAVQTGMEKYSLSLELVPASPAGVGAEVGGWVPKWF